MTAAVAAGLLQGTQALGLTLEEVQRWLEGPHLHPLADSDRRAIAATVADLQARIRQWQNEPTLLVVVFLGGTGVGKSTLLNTLAGEAVAAAGLMRPTTQFPTVYHHRSVKLERLDPRFRQCKTVAHDRAELRDKILVDTPDMDGNVREHHERLREFLPLADAVLYIGSQEKYHDRELWNLLLEHRRARGFAFVLNKWDRCIAGAGDRAGRSPDADLRRSLAQAGFENPLLFRTVASQWALRRIHHQEPDDPIDDELLKLEAWLEEGLHEQAIRAIKVQGISGRLDELVEQLETVLPPDWTGKATQLRGEWATALREATIDQSAALLRAGDAQAKLFDAYFRHLDRRDYGGLFGWYLTIVELLARVHWSLRPQLGAVSLGAESRSAGPLGDWARRCLAQTPALTRETHQEDLVRHLLALANRRDWPLAALEACLPSERALGVHDQTVLRTLEEVVAELELDVRSPRGGQHALRAAYRLAADWLPWAVVLWVLGRWFWDVLFHQAALVTMTPILLALMFLVLTLMLLHVVLVRLLPMQWLQLRGRVGRGLEAKLTEQISPPFLKALDAFQLKMQTERAALEQPLRVLHDLQSQLQRFRTGDEQASLFARERNG